MRKMILSAITALGLALSPALAEPNEFANPDAVACETVEQVVLNAEAAGIQTIVLKGEAAVKLMFELFDRNPPPQRYLDAVANTDYDNFAVVVQDPATVPKGVPFVKGATFIDDCFQSTLGFNIIIPIALQLLGEKS